MEKAQKRNWITFALCVLVICVVLVIVSFFIPLYPEICSKNEYTYQKDCSTHYIAVFLIRYLGEAIEAHNGAIVAVATIFIAGFTYQLRAATIGLKDSTNKLWEAGEKQYGVAKQAADAADLSARAAIAIELPIIRINPGSLGFSSSESSQGYWIGNVILSNLGRTKAFPIEIQIGYTVGNGLPESPIYQFSKPFLPNDIIEPDPKITHQMSTAEFEFEVSRESIDRVTRNEMNLWVYCKLIYLDFMQNRHEAGFCWLRHESIGTGYLRSDATPAYNRKT